MTLWKYSILDVCRHGTLWKGQLVQLKDLTESYVMKTKVSTITCLSFMLVNSKETTGSPWWPSHYKSNVFTFLRHSPSIINLKFKILISTLLDLILFVCHAPKICKRQWLRFNFHRKTFSWSITDFYSLLRIIMHLPTNISILSPAPASNLARQHESCGPPTVI